MLSMFAVALLLSLTAAAPTPEECVDLNKTLSAEEMHMIIGKWITHEIYVLSSHDFSHILKNTTSAHGEFSPSENKQTVLYKQASMKDEGCHHFSVNFTVVGNSIKGMSDNVNSTTEAYFLRTCDDCLLMRYHTDEKDGKRATLLFFYKKSETLPQADQEKAREQAKCLGFVEPPQFIYKQAELCPAKSDAQEPEQ